MAKNKYVKLQLEINVEENDFNTFKQEADATQVTPLDFIKASAEFFLTEQAHGGLMLVHDDIRRVEKNSGIKVTKPSDIVKALEGSKGKPAGQYSFQVEVDPALVSNVEEFARQQNLTMQQVVLNWWSFILANGWLAELNPEGMWIPFTHDQIQKLREILGDGNLNSTNIFNKVKESV